MVISFQQQTNMEKVFDEVVYPEELTLKKRTMWPILSLTKLPTVLAPVSQKVVNCNLDCTTVFTISDRFTKLTDFQYMTFFGRKLPTGSEQS